ncbi:Dyp-type peroxidase [Neisseriaceae bacterium ESL0693]|nr:Dyp-type peroxidase [Neisseriaceae bacterium ESL0693]
MQHVRIPPVVTFPGNNAIFITLGIHNNDSAHQAVLDFAANFSALLRSFNNRFHGEHFNALLGIGSDGWDRLFPNQPKPKELVPFTEIKGARYTAVSTPGDLFFHIRADRHDICFEFAAIIQEQLANATYAIDETHGFRYLDGRAIIGFVDGTENPEDVLKADYALVGAEDPQFRYGSYAFTQKYLHNMEAWRAIGYDEQEKVIGRHRFNDIELTDAEKPKNAHNNVSKAYDAEGNELKIVRANVAFANATNNEYGTFFIGYARSFSTTRQMLEHMFTGNEEGYTDRLLDFSTAISGCLFFVPSPDFLDNISA